MLADDVFRKELASVIAKLTAWADGLNGTGKVDVREGIGFWSVSARPATPGACPVTLVLRADQKFDVSLAGERFEDRRIEDLSLFPALLEAVADGRVERRNTFCALTGAARAMETRVLLQDGKTWTETVGSPLAQASDTVIEETTRFLPYRR